MDDPTTGAAAAPPSEPDHDPALPYDDFRVRRGQIRVFDRSDDGRDMSVVEAFGVSVLIRLRAPRVGEAPELYVRMENEGRPHIDLAVEVDNRSETRYRL
jgi:hypothetical protein